MFYYSEETPQSAINPLTTIPDLFLANANYVHGRTKLRRVHHATKQTIRKQTLNEEKQFIFMPDMCNPSVRFIKRSGTDSSKDK